MAARSKAILFFVLGGMLSTLPVAAAILSYFPLWLSRESETAVSGLCLCLLLLSAVPLLRIIRGALRSPSATVLWGIVFLLFFAFSRIAHEVTVIALVGFVSNLLGSVLFRLSGRYRE